MPRSRRVARLRGKNRICYEEYPPLRPGALGGAPAQRDRPAAARRPAGVPLVDGRTGPERRGLPRARGAVRLGAGGLDGLRFPGLHAGAPRPHGGGRFARGRDWGFELGPAGLVAAVAGRALRPARAVGAAAPRAACAARGGRRGRLQPRLRAVAATALLARGAAGLEPGRPAERTFSGAVRYRLRNAGRDVQAELRGDTGAARRRPASCTASPSKPTTARSRRGWRSCAAPASNTPAPVILDGRPPVERVVRFQVGDDAMLLGQEIEDLERDRVYEESVEMAGRFGRAAAARERPGWSLRRIPA